MSVYDEEREKFFALLTRKACTRKRAAEILSGFRVPDEVKESFMNEAEDIGIIDDEGYARLFADGHRHWGNAKITYELGARGISRRDIMSALDEIDDESYRAREIAESLRRSGIDERKIKSRLMSRGFSGRAVSNV